MFDLLFYGLDDPGEEGEILQLLMSIIELDG